MNSSKREITPKPSMFRMIFLGFFSLQITIMFKISVPIDTINCINATAKIVNFMLMSLVRCRESLIKFKDDYVSGYICQWRAFTLINPVINIVGSYFIEGLS